MGLLLIATGMLFERPNAGVMGMVVSSGPAGTILRRFVPAAILTPILLKAVITRLLLALGIDDLGLVFAVLVASMSVVAIFLLAVTAPRLNRTHEALESSRARISELVEQAPDGIFVADLDGRYREVNEAACRMLGYPRDELLGKTIVDLIPSEDAPRLWQSRAAATQGWHRRRPTGCCGARMEHFLPVEVNATILPDGRWQAIVRDISERKRAQEKLREAQERFDLALRGADLATWDWNVQSGEVIFNQRWAEMRGFRPDEIKPHVDSWISGVHPEDWPQVQKVIG